MTGWSPEKAAHHGEAPMMAVGIPQSPPAQMARAGAWVPASLCHSNNARIMAMINSPHELYEYCTFENPDPTAVAVFFGDAVLAWMACQKRGQVSVAETMLVWNCSRECLNEVASHHHSLFLNGDMLEIDGDA